jgi:hypothetical protein
MSFNQKITGRGYAPGYFLASADCDRMTYEISASHSQAITIGDKKIVPAGAVIPSNDGNAVGILFEDVEVTTGNMPGSVVTRGAVYEDKLPAAIESTAEAVLPGIRVITASPAVVRPASFALDTLTELTVVSEAGSASGKTDVSYTGYTKKTGEREVYKIGASVAPSATLGQILDIGSGSNQWTAATFPLDELAATGKITVAVVDSTDAVIAAGSASIVTA